MRLYIGPKRRIKHTAVFIVLLLIPVLVFTYVLIRINPVYLDHAASYVFSDANIILNKKIEELCDKLSADYDDFIILKQDSTGKITAINTNTGAINKFKSRIASDIETLSLNMDDGYVHIPIGSVLGWPVFSAAGPKLKFKVFPIGKTEIDFTSDFSDAGINQVCHSLYINAAVTFSITNSVITHDETVKTKVLIGETVIVGDVPQFYGNGGLIKGDIEND